VADVKVLVGMSGGVDSSVAAALLRDAGHEVVGVTMRLWGGESDTGCCSVSDVDDARRAAQQLGVEHVVFNFSDEFDRHVVGPYVDAHRNGQTPNPCIECNRHLKFDRLVSRAEQLGFDAVATGHHARVGTHDDGSFRLERGADRAKDQSYVLHMLDSRALDGVLLPVGEFTKDEVRSKAAELGLRTAAKPDSQDVCFIPTTDGRSGFLESRMAFTPARVVDRDGVELGEVPAVELVTLGQRRGLGLPGGGPVRYVVGIERGDGNDGPQVVVSGPEDLLSPGERVGSVVWSRDPEPGHLLVQTSAHGDPIPAEVVVIDERTVDIRWTLRQPRVAPGQSIVLYDPSDRWVVGGGIVEPPAVPVRL
jgi:tRNA-specific 2-thiouridylase